MPKSRILIAEENTAILKILKSSLQSSDYELTTARDGASVLKYLSEQDPCLIIMDLLLPKLNGWQLLELLKNHKNGTIPVILISSESQPATDYRTIYKRVEALFTAPLNELQITRTVDRILADPSSLHEPCEMLSIGLVNTEKKGKHFLRNLLESGYFKVTAVHFLPSDTEGILYAEKHGIHVSESTEALINGGADYIINSDKVREAPESPKEIPYPVFLVIWHLLQERQQSEKREKKQIRDFRDRLHEFSLLSDMAQIITSTMEMETLLYRIMKLSVEVIEASAGALVMYDKERQKFTVASACSLSQLFIERVQLPLSDPTIEDIITLRREMAVSDLQQIYSSPLSQMALKEGMNSMLAIPLPVQEKIIGILCLFSRKRREFTDREKYLLSTMAGQVAISIENAQLYKSSVQKQIKVEQLLSKIIVAQEEERKRIAGEIHDSIAQSMVGILTKVQTSQALLSVNPQTVSEELEELRKVVAESVKEVREIIYNLRPSSLDDLGLVPSLENFIKRIQKAAKIDIQLIVNERGKRLPPIIETVAFRVVQEALNNVKKHAQAEKAWIELYYEPMKLSMKIVDNGKGFNWDAVSHKMLEGDSVGLLSMKERVSLFGGTVDIISEENRGTTVSAELPIERMSVAPDNQADAHA